ncbi:hypothetical protein VZC37_16410 [Gordonia sp. LSe1-13]|uniref:Uncharacterized protein n=1 Tax=Gordonia sesuvii TaxID=3116777 RepID=A0ABU7MH44_9ACTN|nr:hypothetical protein [Gordonia sp. LSe1-13]
MVAATPRVAVRVDFFRVRVGGGDGAGASNRAGPLTRYSLRTRSALNVVVGEVLLDDDTLATWQRDPVLSVLGSLWQLMGPDRVAAISTEHRGVCRAPPDDR